MYLKKKVVYNLLCMNKRDFKSNNKFLTFQNFNINNIFFLLWIYESVNNNKESKVNVFIATSPQQGFISKINHPQQHTSSNLRTGPINIIDLNESIHTDFVSPHNKDWVIYIAGGPLFTFNRNFWRLYCTK